eukprot:m.299677 g.299677  ORF g.299677 m.299677 type:complete len:97 (-) comp16415_c0_seq45:478-768(-)
MAGRSTVSCYIFFYLQRRDKSVLSKTDLERGFLPGGLFPRIVGNAVKHAQEIGNDGDWVLNETHAHLVFGIDDFVMHLEIDLHKALYCICITNRPL